MKKSFLFLLCTWLGWMTVQAACPDHKKLESILKTNVDKDGYVNYDNIRIGKGGDLYEYLSFLETADLKDCSEADKLAFWLNAYNANMIRLVLARPQLKDISGDFKLFGEKFKVAKQNVSLNDIEHRIIRSSPKNGGPMEGLSLKEFDPRAHFGIACGALDSPKLLNHAYVGNSVASVLQANAVTFANNPKNLRIEDGQLTMSTLLNWYADDFSSLGGVSAFLTSLTDNALRPDADEIDEKLKTDFPQNTTFKYDWTLNSIKNKVSMAPPAETQEENSMLAEGDKAPEFKLKDDTGKEVSLKDFKGKNVVLYFYPKDDTPGCTKEACDFRDNLKDYSKKNAVILGVSADDVASHDKFKKKYGLPFQLLSDPDKKTIQAYGVWKEKSMYGKKYMGIERTTFIIDANGKIAKVFPKVSVTGHVDEVLSLLN